MSFAYERREGLRSSEEHPRYPAEQEGFNTYGTGAFGVCPKPLHGGVSFSLPRGIFGTMGIWESWTGQVNGSMATEQGVYFG